MFSLKNLETKPVGSLSVTTEGSLPRRYSYLSIRKVGVNNNQRQICGFRRGQSLAVIPGIHLFKQCDQLLRIANVNLKAGAGDEYALPRDKCKGRS